MHNLEKILEPKPTMIIKSLLSDHIDDGDRDIQSVAIGVKRSGARLGVYAFSTPEGYEGQPCSYKFLVVLMTDARLLVMGHSPCAKKAIMYVKCKERGESDYYGVQNSARLCEEHGQYSSLTSLVFKTNKLSYVDITGECNKVFKGGAHYMRDLCKELYVSLMGEEAFLQAFGTYDFSVQDVSTQWYLEAFRHYASYVENNDRIFTVMLDVLSKGGVFNAIYGFRVLTMKFSLLYFELLSQLQFVGFSRQQIAFWVLRASNECVIKHLQKNAINGQLSPEIVSWCVFAKKLRNELVSSQTEYNVYLIAAVGLSYNIHHYVTLKAMQVAVGTTAGSASKDATTSSLGKRKMTVEPSEAATSQGGLYRFHIQDGRVRSERWNNGDVHNTGVSLGPSGVENAQPSEAILGPQMPDDHCAAMPSFFEDREKKRYRNGQATQGEALGSSNAYAQDSQNTVCEELTQSEWASNETSVHESREQGPNVNLDRQGFLQQGVLECLEEKLEGPLG